jgi:hypothetical protein
MQSEALRVLAERLGISCPVEWRSCHNLAPSELVPVVRDGSCLIMTRTI